MQFALARFLHFPSVGGDSLRELPQRRFPGQSVCGIIVHQQFPDTLAFGFLEFSNLDQFPQFGVEVRVDTAGTLDFSAMRFIF